MIRHFVKGRAGQKKTVYVAQIFFLVVWSEIDEMNKRFSVSQLPKQNASITLSHGGGQVDFDFAWARWCNIKDLGKPNLIIRGDGPPCILIFFGIHMFKRMLYS